MFLRIKDLRIDNDISQKKLAEFLNCSQVAYSYYEINKRQIPLELLCKLSEFYNVSIDYLLGLTNETKPYPRIKNKK